MSTVGMLRSGLYRSPYNGAEGCGCCKDTQSYEQGVLTKHQWMYRKGSRD
jgi:hypothetical protein